MRKLVYEIKDFKGFVLGIGYLKDKILKEMDKNDYIEVSLLTSNFAEATKKSLVDKEIRKRKKKGKTVYIKKLKKSFKYKRPDYIVCNINDVNNYLKYFIKDSLYITNQKIYIFSEGDKVELENIVKKYKRYINTVEYDPKNNYIIIDTSNYYNNIFKNAWYFIVDTFISIYDSIGNVLAG